jgi:hypothetical protein
VFLHLWPILWQDTRGILQTCWPCILYVTNFTSFSAFDFLHINTLTASQNLTIFYIYLLCFVLVIFSCSCKASSIFTKLFCRMFFVSSQNVISSPSLSTHSVLMRLSSLCICYFNSSIDMSPTSTSLILLKPVCSVKEINWILI